MSLTAWLRRPVDARALALCRILVAVGCVVRLMDGLPAIAHVLQGDKALIPYQFSVARAPESALPAILLVWFVAAGVFSIGYYTRLSGLILAGVMTYCLALDQQTYASHFYLLILVVGLLTAGGGGARWSVDALLGRGNRDVSYWPSFLLQCQLSVVYGFAALTKINADYLSGEVLMYHLSRSMDVAWAPVSIWAPLALLSLLTEAFLAAGFWFRRLRVPALVVGLGFHTTIVITLYPVSLTLVAYSLAMFAMYAVFFVDRVPLWTGSLGRLLPFFRRAAIAP